MKEIFDWLREQIKKEEIALEDNFGDYVYCVPTRITLDAITKAEAKWKEDCCEWEYNEFEEQFETSCGVLLNPNSHDREVTHYCCSCGKRIKIAEVERWQS